MTLNRQDPKPTLDFEAPNVSTAITIIEPFAGDDLLEDQNPVSDTKPIPSSVPWPGSTFMIRSISSGHAITLQGGQILLAKPGSVGNSRWECVENSGWLGFRDPGSGRFLGHDKKGRLYCVAPRHNGWEHFCVRHTPEGGYILFVRHWDGLRQVRLIEEQGVETLAKTGHGEGVTWEFLKV